ncbi:MAG: DUF1566 domain-containing protein [Myxococcales bacterium]|nr:DUF1566 domain-containing protein [Myxococcales bacterium]
MTRLPGLAFVLLACGAPPPAKTEAKPDPAPAKPDATPAPAPTTPDAPFATPKAKPPPAPEGAVLLDPPLYVQRCDPAHPCKKLLQPAGETHCRELKLGGLANWRLPDREEAKRFAGNAELADLDGFHWTRTAFAEDGAQAWIFDPKSGQETTIPRTRKPFTVRCVIDP